MQTIITKFIPATDHKPARVKAKQQNDGHGQSVTVGWDDYWNSSRTTAGSRDEVKQCSESVRPHALAALLLTGYATLAVFIKLSAIDRKLHCLIGTFFLRGQIERLARERSELEAAVVASVERLIPDEMEPLYPRDPVST